MELKEELHALAELVAEGLLALTEGLVVERVVAEQGADAINDPITATAIAEASAEECLELLERVGARHPGSQALARVGTVWVTELAAAQNTKNKLAGQPVLDAARDFRYRRERINAHRVLESLERKK